MSRPGARFRFTARRLAIGVAVGSLLLLGLSQLFLPSLASRWVESQTGKYGEDVHVSIEAFPAIKLLLRQADDVKVRARTLDLEGDRSLLGQIKDTTDFSSRIETLKGGRVPLHDVRANKQGDGSFEMTGFMRKRDLEAELPPSVSLGPPGNVQNRIPIRIGSGILGKGVDSELELGTSDGAVVLRVHLPGLLNIVSLQPIVVFRDKHLVAKSFSMKRTSGGWNVELAGSVT